MLGTMTSYDGRRLGTADKLQCKSQSTWRDAQTQLPIPRAKGSRINSFILINIHTDRNKKFGYKVYQYVSTAISVVSRMN